MSPALPTMQGGGQEPKVLVVGNTNPSGNGMNGQVFDAEGLAPTLTTNKGEGSKVLINVQGGAIHLREDEISTCIDANYAKGLDNHGARTGVMCIQRQFKGKYSVNEDVTGTLQASRVDKVPMVVEGGGQGSVNTRSSRETAKRTQNEGTWGTDVHANGTG